MTTIMTLNFKMTTTMTFNGKMTVSAGNVLSTSQLL